MLKKLIIFTVLPLMGAQVFAQEKTFQVLEYLKSISGEKTVAGQHNREPNSDPDKWTNEIFATAGKYPGLWSGDFLFQAENIAHRQTMIDEAIEQWKNGAIINIMLHTCPPTSEEPCRWNPGVTRQPLSDAQWKELIIDGTTLNNNWKARLDIITPYLQQLKDAGVEVMFRPLHEMNQKAFWWGGRRGPNGTARLFRITHDYLADVKGLDNLIWVWDMQDIDRTWAQYNPGDEYWDILCFDVYSNGYSQSWYDYAVSIAGDKPLAIGECSKLPSLKQLDSQPKYVFFMAWAELVYKRNTPAEITELYNSSRVITRDELPFGQQKNEVITGDKDLEAAVAGGTLFDIQEIRDESTLAVEVLQDWHVVDGKPRTRQKSVTICVGQVWPGLKYRIPVRMIVPADRKATGFHLTGDHRPEQLRRDARLRGIETDLIEGGVGLVYTIVQEPGVFGQRELGEAMSGRFIKTLNPHYSIQYWGWPATIMRAVTAAYAERDYFTPGKVAVSGGSKNGASPTVSLICDDRITALLSIVGPIYDSPLRLCDRTAWDVVEADNRRFFQKVEKGTIRLKRPKGYYVGFIGGTFGPNYNRKALEAGHTWNEIRQVALDVADDLFVSRNWKELTARGVDILFHPTTHDYNAFDILWGAHNYPQIPVYYKANGGHGQKAHHAAEQDENLPAFILGHFFDDMEPMLEPSTVSHEVSGNKLLVTIRFKTGSKAESGRIWWMYDRGPEGSAAYLWQPIPEDQWKDMKFDTKKNAWTAGIELNANASHIDFFSNHEKTLRYKSREYRTFISSPYTRVYLMKRSSSGEN